MELFTTPIGMLCSTVTWGDPDSSVKLRNAPWFESTNEQIKRRAVCSRWTSLGNGDRDRLAQRDRREPTRGGEAAERTTICYESSTIETEYNIIMTHGIE